MTQNMHSEEYNELMENIGIAQALLDERLFLEKRIAAARQDVRAAQDDYNVRGTLKAKNDLRVSKEYLIWLSEKAYK